MKWSIAGLLAIGIVAAVSASVLVASLRQPQPAADQSKAKSEPKDKTVLVAARPMLAMEIVASDAVKQQTVSKSDAPVHSFADPAQAVGKVLIVPLVEGQVITKDCFAAPGSGLRLAASLPEGMRAVSVSLSNFASLRGLLYPGCAVDVLASFRMPHGSRSKGEAISTTLLRGVQVLAVNTRTVVEETPSDEKDKDKDKDKAKRKQSSTTRRSNLVTLMVNSRQAEALQLASHYGEVSLALRNPRDLIAVRDEATLLAGGQLAKLADVMASSVPSEEIGSDYLIASRQHREAQFAADATTSPLPQPVDPGPRITARPVWETVVIRGGKYERLTFDMPKGTEEQLENQD